MRKRFLFAAIIPALIALSFIGIQNSHAANQPNILLIFADDLGINDLSSYGSEIKTPHIDSIGRDGLKFTQYYTASPICTPSRFGLMTGQYPNRSQDKLLGALMFVQERDDHRGIRPHETTIAEVLRENGYRTAIIGKWHLGHGEPGFSALNHGFDYQYGSEGGCVNYFTMKYGYKPDWARNGKQIVEEGYSTDLISDDAVRYLSFLNSEVEMGGIGDTPVPSGHRTDGTGETSQSETDARKSLNVLSVPSGESPLGTGQWPVLPGKKEKPFFLFLSYTAPHYGKGFDEKAQKLTNILQSKPEDRARFPHITDTNRLEYAGMVAAMDDGVGRVLETLKKQKLDENTLVIFISDNGGDYRYGGSNKPFRGQKAQLFEGGIRLPCLMRWPGKIKAGTVTDQPISGLDFYPTFCSLAGVSNPRSRAAELHPAVALDGVDISPVFLKGKKQSRDLFWQLPNSDAFRRGPWKYVRAAKEEMLFNLNNDPAEEKNLAKEKPELFRELKDAHGKIAATFPKP